MRGRVCIPVQEVRVHGKEQVRTVYVLHSLILYQWLLFDNNFGRPLALVTRLSWPQIAK